MAEEKTVSGKAFAYLFILRWSIALIFLLHGIQKWNDPSFGVGAEKFFMSLQDDVIFSPYKIILKEFVIPNASLFASLVKYGELAVGFGYLLGVPLRITSFFGIVMNANYLMVASVPSLIYLNLLMIVCQFVVVGTHRE